MHFNWRNKDVLPEREMKLRRRQTSSCESTSLRLFAETSLYTRAALAMNDVRRAAQRLLSAASPLGETPYSGE